MDADRPDSKDISAPDKETGREKFSAPLERDQVAHEDTLPGVSANPGHEAEAAQHRAEGARAVIDSIPQGPKVPEQESGSEVLESLDQAYDYLQGREQREPLPTDVIPVRVSPANLEYAALQEAGLSPEQIASGRLTRQELLDSGFRFVNILGNGEKGVINGVVTDPEDGREVDFTGRVLLTQSELELVYRYQQSQPERYGLQSENIDEVRKDMVSFVREAVATPAFDSNNAFESVLLRREADFYGPVTGTDAEWETVDKYWSVQIKDYQKGHKGAGEISAMNVLREQFALKHCRDIYTWKTEESGGAGAFRPRTVRGHAINSTPSRAEKLRGQASPFLESGFSFEENLDANVFLGTNADQRSSDQLRINTATIHLAGAHPDFPGFSEMGGATDQQYMTTGAYIEELYPRDAAERQTVHEHERATIMGGSRHDLMIKAQQRLINVAAQEMSESDSHQKKRWYHRLRKS